MPTPADDRPDLLTAIASAKVQPGEEQELEDALRPADDHPAAPQRVTSTST